MFDLHCGMLIQQAARNNRVLKGQTAVSACHAKQALVLRVPRCILLCAQK